jgi:hypothetical protein
MHVQLPRDGAHAPLLHRVQAQDLRHQVRGYGHGAVARASRGAGSPGARLWTAAGRSVGRSSTARRWPALGRRRASQCPWRCRQVRRVVLSCVHATSGADTTAGWEPWCVTLCSPTSACPAASRSARRRRHRRERWAWHDTPAPGPLVALRGLAPCLGAGLTPAKTAAIAVAAVAAAAQDDLHAASRAQVQAGGLVHAHPGTTEVLDGLVPARHTAAAPPSSARCRARYGRQACRQSDRCRAHLLRHRSRCTAPCHDCRRTASTASAPLPPSSRPAPARPPCRAAWLARIPSQPGPSHSRIPATTTTRQNRHLTGE